MKPQDIIPREINQAQKDKVPFSQLHAEIYKVGLLETEITVVVARAWGGR